MKNICVIAVICFISMSVHAYAQDTITVKRNPVKLSAGFMLAPQGGVNLHDTKKGFSNYSLPLFIVATISIKKISITPFYSITANSIGVAVECSFHKWGMYGVGTKNAVTPHGYVGIGFDTPVFDGKAAAFVEFGTITNKYDPYLYTGVFIPLTFKIR